ncbi:MAG: insulinase family protein [Phycisphaerae bacterium]|nr:insulinase family protein [Phycisphaerae bacterium]
MIQPHRNAHLLASGLTLMAVGCSTAVTRITIPNRPEKLTYPPLVYHPPTPADYRVPLAAGPVAYLVPDRSRPLITVQVLVRAPAYAVPAGKEPLNSLLADLLTQGGTQSQTAEQLEERLEFLAAELGVHASHTEMSARLNILTKDFDQGLAILRQILTTPRFQEDRLNLLKQQELQAMRERNDASAGIEQRERGFLAFGESFFTNRHATAASLQSVTRDDLVAFHRQFFHPANMVLAVSGDFDRAEMIRKLDTFLSDWPITGKTAPPCPTDATFAAPGVYLVNKPEVNQGRVGVLLPGIRRDNPDYYAVTVMNDILGGGGFTSRIMKRVRSDEGLAYSAGSHFPAGVHYPLFFAAGFQTKARTVAFATSIVLTEMKRIAAEPVSDQELHTSKRSFIDVFPNNFVTADQIAATFANDEFTGRYASDPDYWKNYRAKIDALTKTDIQRVAGQYLTPEKVVILVVGPREEILKGHPDHPVTLQSLSPGSLKDLPLRDPLTLKPMTR